MDDTTANILIDADNDLVLIAEMAGEPSVDKRYYQDGFFYVIGVTQEALDAALANYDRAAYLLRQQIPVENEWRESQMVRVANQLLMLEDNDPSAEPGTARQWRDYRIELRKWIEGNVDFPDQSKRPVAPE